MKKIILPYILLFIISQISFSQEYSWIDISNNLPDADAAYTDVFALGNDVWITTFSELEIYYNNAGGTTNFTTYTTPARFLSIHMISSTVGYAGAYGGNVYRTADGGVNWTLLFPLTGSTVNAITFPPTDAEPGYCCGENGKTYSITSLGTTEIANSTVSNMKSITFPVSSSEGWVCGESTILHFANNAWNSDQGVPGGTYNGIHFVNNNNGWAVGSNGSGSGQIINTTNGGTSWTLQTDPSPSSGVLNEVFFLSDQEGWAGGNFGKILYTSDGGANWNVINTGATNLIEGIHFTSSNNGYIVGGNGDAVKYTQLSYSIDQACKNDFDFSISPNPCNNTIRISCPKLGLNNGTIQILSINGNLLMENKIRGRQETIDLNIRDLKSGTYLCKVLIENNMSTQKIVKE